MRKARGTIRFASIDFTSSDTHKDDPCGRIEHGDLHTQSTWSLSDKYTQFKIMGAETL